MPTRPLESRTAASRRAHPLLISLATLSAACSGPGGLPGSFVDDVYAAHCEFLVRCGLSTEAAFKDVASCVSVVKGAYANALDTPEALLADVTDGRVTVTPAALPGCLDAISGRSCPSQGRPAPLQDLAACGGLFAGSVASGSTCRASASCGSGTTCQPTSDVACEGSCVADADKPCSMNEDCPADRRCIYLESAQGRRCAAPMAEGAVDCQDGWCAGDLVCASDGTAFRCTPPAADGESCQATPCAASLRCAEEESGRVCRPRLAEGAACDPSGDACVAGFECPSGGEGPTCTRIPTAAAEGESCVEGAASRPSGVATGCATGLACRSSWLDGNGRCVRPRAIGEACTSDAECDVTGSGPGGAAATGLSPACIASKCAWPPGPGEPCHMVEAIVAFGVCDGTRAFCDEAATPPTCRGFLGAGSACTSSRQCGGPGAVCNLGLCAAPDTSACVASGG